MAKVRFLTKEQMLTGDGAPRPLKPPRPTVLTDIDLADFRRALLILVDVVERMKGQRPRTTEIREMHRKRQRDERRAEVLTIEAECDKL